MIIKLYEILLRIFSDLPLEKFSTRVLLIPDNVVAISMLLYSLILARIFGLHIDLPEGLFLFLVYQAFTFILFSSHRPTDKVMIKKFRNSIKTDHSLKERVIFYFVMLFIPITLCIFIF